MTSPPNKNVRGPSSDPFQEMRDFLLGDLDGEPGLVSLVKENAKAVASLVGRVDKHDQDMYGNGGEGMVHVVRRHERLAQKGEAALVWVIRLLATEVIGAVAYVLWQVLKEAPVG